VRPPPGEVEGPAVEGGFDRMSDHRPVGVLTSRRPPALKARPPPPDTAPIMPVPHGLTAGAGTAPDGAVDAAVLRSAVALQREIAADGVDLATAMRRIAERTRPLTGATTSSPARRAGRPTFAFRPASASEARSRSARSTRAGPSSASTRRTTPAPTPRWPARSGSGRSPASRCSTAARRSAS